MKPLETKNAYPALAALVERMRDVLEKVESECRADESEMVKTFIELYVQPVLQLTPPAALEALRRRERSIGAEEELRRIADLIETEVLDERFAALFCADLRDRADAIAAERKEEE